MKYMQLPGMRIPLHLDFTFSLCKWAHLALNQTMPCRKRFAIDNSATSQLRLYNQYDLSSFGDTLWRRKIWMGDKF